MSDNYSNLVSAGTLAKMLKVSTAWVYAKRSRLPHVVIDGRPFFKVKESVIVKSTLSHRKVKHFVNGKRLHHVGILMERADADRLKAIMDKEGVSGSEFVRRALIHTYLNGKGSGK